MIQQESTPHRDFPGSPGPDYLEKPNKTSPRKA
jgi:hypothetical protein